METNICVAGFGGQGVMTIGKFLAQAVCEDTILVSFLFVNNEMGAVQKIKQLVQNR